MQTILATIHGTQLSERVDSFLKGAPLNNYIGGRWVPGHTESFAPVMDPSTGQQLTRVPLSGAADVDAAVAAATKAFPAWAGMPPQERAEWLNRLADALTAHKDDLAQIEALDVGKAIRNAEAFDIPFGIECLRFFADVAVNASYNISLSVSGMDARVHRTPFGVCAFILPWNFPFDLLMWGIVPALAAGNTVVVKPSEVTPLSTLYFCKVLDEIGFPPGVVNVVLGDGAGVGSALSAHSGIQRMAFTGSPQVGKMIAEICGRNLVPCKLELGGKGAAVIFEDTDIDATARQLAGAITLNTGQVCCTATRWLVQDRIFDEFTDRVRTELSRIQIGPSLQRTTEMGPLTSEAHLSRVSGMVARGEQQGAAALYKGAPANAGEGYYFSPVLLSGTSENICCTDEIFGPVAFLLPFREEQEAVALVNKSRYGLANSVWSTDPERAGRVAEKLVAGNCWLNAHNVFAYGLPYGGVNLSGFGGGVNSRETFFDYLRSQTIAQPHA